MKRKTDSRKEFETGSSLVESLLIGLFTLVPIVFIVIEVGFVQRAAIATAVAAREAGRSFVTAPAPSDALGRAEAVAHQIITLHQLEPAKVSVLVDGELKRGSQVAVEVAYVTPAVPVPLIGSIPGFKVSSRHVEQVDRHRSIQPK